VRPPDGTTGWGKSYGIYFDSTWAFGGRGWMAVIRPDVEKFREDGNGDGNPDGSWGTAWLLSDTSVLSHEFGHSMQGAYGVRGFGADYDFAGKMMKPTGEEYDWGHGGWQHAEMGTAMNEGIANTYGQYLLNRCNTWDSAVRPVAVSIPPFNGGIWSQSTSCDSVDACGYHHTRWHLRGQRGFGESSTAFTARSTRIANLITAMGATSGATRVISNNEQRVGEFGCDLLDSDSSVTHASAVTTGFNYISDFTYWVTEYLDGNTAPTPVARNYSGAARAETVQLSLAQLLESYGNFCADCDASFPGSRAWGSTYNTKRLSINGSISPQAMGRYMEGRGWINRSDLNNVLRTNFMEEVP